MSRTLRSIFISSVLLSCVLALGSSLSWAKDAPEYPSSGKVLFVSSTHGYVYQVETGSSVYLLMCEKVDGSRIGPPECEINDKPIAAGDTIKLRPEGEWAYIPASNGTEEGLRVLTDELKVIPPIPPQAGESAKAGAGVRGIVIGTGAHIKGQKELGWSTNPEPALDASHRYMLGLRAAHSGNSGIQTASPAAPVMPTGPVLATPVTGGPPVMVMAAGPVSGGMVMGTTPTGQPVTAVAVAPVMGTPTGGGNLGALLASGVFMVDGDPPKWVHLLRIQAGDKTYQLECSEKPCELNHNEIDLGDMLVIRVENQWAYVSSGAGGKVKEEKFKILSDADEKSGSNPSADGKPAGDSK